MHEYRHHVSGFFARRQEAERAVSRLIDQGLPRSRLHLLEAGSVPPVVAPQSDSNAVLKDVFVDGAIGVAVGTGIGALAEFALVAANVSLFIASPLIAPLVMLGWGASLGGFVGGAVGAESHGGDKEGKFSTLIRDAISSGQVVLVVETRTQQETAVAGEIIKASVGDYEDIGTV
jgi:hypothetical protein